MKYLLCEIQFGASRQQIYYVNDQENTVMPIAQVSIAALPDLLVGCVAEHSCNNIVLVGPDDYIDGLRKDINDIATIRYNNMNINVYTGGIGADGKVSIEN